MAVKDDILRYSDGMFKRKKRADVAPVACPVGGCGR